ncbi:MAG TPA: hypothetical protein VFI37_09575 [Gaiellaceae bacterium]|jgi:hypothetical protein|nr:hypothetical protein [Gaiellaceae bacterium]
MRPIYVNRRGIERELRARIWPLLTAEGFELFAAHAAWRPWDAGVDLLDVRFVGDDAASFRLTAGVHFHAVPATRRLRHLHGRLAPGPGQCDVVRAYAPGPSRAGALDREVWRVDDANLDELLGDLRSKVRRAARSLDVLHDPRRALGELGRRTRWRPRAGEPGWLRVTGYLAAAVGEYDLARSRLTLYLHRLEGGSREAARVRGSLALLP